MAQHHGLHGPSSVPHTAEVLGDIPHICCDQWGWEDLRGSGHLAHIYKGLPVLPLVGSQRFLCVAPVHRVCGTSPNTDEGKVTKGL